LEFLWIEFIPVFASLPAHTSRNQFSLALELHTGGTRLHTETHHLSTDEGRSATPGIARHTNTYQASSICLSLSAPLSQTTYIQLHTTCKAYQYMRALQIRQSW
jgi:hypothetical protein